jgi:hypothetical protein
LDWSPRDVDELFRKAANAIAHAEAIGRLIEMRRRERERGERIGLRDVGLAAEPQASTKRYCGSVIACRRVDNERSRFLRNDFHGCAPIGFKGSPWAVWAGVAPAPARPSTAHTHEAGPDLFAADQCRAGEELRNDGAVADRTRASALGARTPFARKRP